MISLARGGVASSRSGRYDMSVSDLISTAIIVLGLCQSIMTVPQYNIASRCLLDLNEGCNKPVDGDRNANNASHCKTFRTIVPDYSHKGDSQNRIRRTTGVPTQDALF